MEREAPEVSLKVAIGFSLFPRQTPDEDTEDKGGWVFLS